MSVADRVRGVINPTRTLAEQAAAEASELEHHIERTKTERARRVATETDLQRRLTEAQARQDLLKARRDLASAFDDVAQIDQDLAVVCALVGELTAELTEAQDGIRRADVAIPDFQQRQRAAAATVITEQRRENLAVLEAILPELEDAYRATAEIQRRAYVAANREDVLRSNPAALRPDGTATPSLIPPMGYLGPDLSQAPEQLQKFRAQLGKL
jgi:DNA repair exonuclease SbcCD ATPase subunit